MLSKRKITETTTKVIEEEYVAPSPVVDGEPVGPSEPVVSKDNRQRKLCEHNKRKDRCKDCGTGLCEHNRRKDSCKDCSTGLCEHGRWKAQCQKCGTGLCEHGRFKSRCKDCGTGLCEHGRYRNQCKDCGTRRCEHGRQKGQCRDCGTGLCEHGRWKSHCTDCGTGLCKHGKRKSECRDCMTADQLAASKRFCDVCLVKHLGPSRVRAGVRLCAECDASAPMRIEHIVMPMIVSSVGYPMSAMDDALFGGAACGMSTRSRPDGLWASQEVCVVLEVDEKSHGDREALCETGRMSDLTEALQRLTCCSTPVYFIRFNPDACDTERASLDRRVEVVSDRIKEILFDEANHYHPDDGLDTHEVPRAEYYFYHSNQVAQHADFVRDSPWNVKVFTY